MRTGNRFFNQGRRSHLLLLGLAVSGVMSVWSSELSAQTTLQSVSTEGSMSNRRAGSPSITPDGRYIVFESDGTNLVANDTNGSTDIFLRDRTNATTERVSLDSAGNQIASSTFDPAVSSSGQFVAFWSSDGSIVSGDTNGVADVFLRDRTGATTTRVSVSNGGAQGNDSSYLPAISANGRYVAFISGASNLTSIDPSDKLQVYLRDLNASTTALVSASSTAIAGNKDADASRLGVSDDGDTVVFASNATNLVATDSNNVADVFVKVLSSGAISRVSVNSLGQQSNKPSRYPSISASGQYVAFESEASNLVTGDTNRVRDVFLHDRSTGQTSRVSVGPDGVQGNGESSAPRISADGRYVVYESLADNLVANFPERAFGDTAPLVFVFDRVTGTNALVSSATDGELANDFAIRPAVSNGATVVTFESGATNIASGIPASFDTASLDVVFANVDQCPDDPAKRIPGVCGCGLSDSDADGDGVVACNDGCPEDSDKTAPGACGCGIPDTDDDGSGIADCDDPKFDSVPGAPSVTRRGRRITVEMDEASSSAVFRIVVYSGSVSRPKVIRSLRVTDNPATFTLAVEKRTRAFVRYQVTLGGITTQLSEASGFFNVSLTRKARAERLARKRTARS